MLDETLRDLKQRDQDTLDAQKQKLDEQYGDLPRLIARTAALAQMDEELLVRCCYQAAWRYQDVSWQLALDIVRSFYLAKARIEQGKGGETAHN